MQSINLLSQFRQVPVVVLVFELGADVVQRHECAGSVDVLVNLLLPTLV